jgi:hypothetical protein
MKYTTIVGVHTERQRVPYAAAGTTALCLEHQDLEVPGEPIKEPLTAIQAYYANAHCAACGIYLGLPESQVPGNEQRRPEDGEKRGARLALLTDHEMRLLVQLLRRMAEYTSDKHMDRLDLAELVPSREDRLELLRASCIQRGDLGELMEAQADDYRFWTYTSALAYFVRRIAPDLAARLSQVQAER